MPKSLFHNMEERYVLNDLFLACMCKRFVDVPGTKILILNGELSNRIKRRIDDADIPFICDFLNDNQKVVSANLAYNKITNKGMRYIVSFLDENKSLLELNLMNNSIKAKGILRLAQLKDKLGLKSLRLNGNKIGSKGLKALAAMLCCAQSLVSLDIGQTDQSLESVADFSHVLRTNNRTLQALTLDRVIGPLGHSLQTDVLASHLSQVLRVNNVLKELHLRKIVFVDHDIEILVDGLMENRSLLLLDLSCNNIGDFGVECLARYLGAKPPLLTLLLSSNNIGDTGARSLSFKFPYTDIVHMDISRNKITDEGLLDVLNCLKKERPLTGLFLRENKIGEKTCKVLYRMVRSGVILDSCLDVKVFWDREGFSCTSCQDHITPHYYCLCAHATRPHCRMCTLMNIRNK